MSVHFILTGGTFSYQYYLSVFTAFKTQKQDIKLWVVDSIEDTKYLDMLPKDIRASQVINVPNFKALIGKPDHFRSAHLKDYLSYKVLYEYGGTCMDLDTVSLGDITEIIGDKEMMIPSEMKNPNEIRYAFNSAILSGKKGSPLLRELIEQAESILNKNDITWGECGPMLVSDIAHKYIYLIAIPPVSYTHLTLPTKRIV